MKKKIISVLILLIITGCGNKITCKSTGGTDELKITEKYVIEYNDDYITNLYIKKSYKFKDKQKYINFEKIINNAVKSLDQKNIKVSVKKKNKKYTLVQDYNFSAIDDEQLQTLALIRNKNEFISQLEGNGLKCK